MVFGWQSGNGHSSGHKGPDQCAYVHVVDADLKGYFAERGLYSLVTAHASVVNPP